MQRYDFLEKNGNLSRKNRRIDKKIVSLSWKMNFLRYKKWLKKDFSRC